MKPLYLRPWPEHLLATRHWAYAAGRLADLLGLPAPSPTLPDWAGGHAKVTQTLLCHL